MTEVKEIKNEEITERLESLINHGLSITTISEETGLPQEEIAEYICSTWKNKERANIDKMNRAAFRSGTTTVPVSENNCIMLIKKKK